MLAYYTDYHAECHLFPCEVQRSLHSASVGQEQYLLGCVVTAALQALLAMTGELSCKDAAL